MYRFNPSHMNKYIYIYIHMYTLINIYIYIYKSNLINTLTESGKSSK